MGNSSERKCSIRCYGFLVREKFLVPKRKKRKKKKSLFPLLKHPKVLHPQSASSLRFFFSLSLSSFIRQSLPLLPTAPTLPYFVFHNCCLLTPKLASHLTIPKTPLNFESIW